MRQWSSIYLGLAGVMFYNYSSPNANCVMLEKTVFDIKIPLSIFLAFEGSVQ